MLCLIDALTLILSSVLYLVNVLFIRKYGGSFFVSHFNDVCCGIWFLAYSNLLLKLIGKRLNDICAIMLYLFGWAIVWEYFGPIINKSSTCDNLDILAYLSGGVIYKMVMQVAHMIFRHYKT